MKLQAHHKTGFHARARHQDGMAVIVVIALFAIMLLFLGSTLRSLNHLNQDLKLIERQQLQRLRQSQIVTNVAGTNRLTLSPRDGPHSLSFAPSAGGYRSSGAAPGSSAASNCRVPPGKILAGGETPTSLAGEDARAAQYTGVGGEGKAFTAD